MRTSAGKEFLANAINRAFVNPLYGERIAESIGGLFKGHAMLTKIRGGLATIPLKL